MQVPAAVAPPRKSAFAAAFLSFVFPGLGHAYVGRWLRALLWAALPILLIIGAAVLALSPERSEYATALADPDMLVGVLGFIGVDLVYRLFAMLDAFRLARDPSTGSSGTRMLSVMGLMALLLVLLASHVAVARPVLLAYDTLNIFSESSGDESEIPDLDDLGADFDFLRETPAPVGTGSVNIGAGSAKGPRATKAPDVTSTPEATAEATPETIKVKEWTDKERLNILLIGADGGRKGSASYLTDTMIVVSVDPKTKRIAFISLPRDSSGIPLPRMWPAYNRYGGRFTGKINTLYTTARFQPSLFPGSNQQRGYEALMGALGELYGIDIPYYVAVDLDSFRKTVNTLGGVVVDVQLPVQDRNYPADDGRGNLKLYVPPGMQAMNGQQALAYARSRHATSDFDRSARQQRVITSLRDQTNLSSLFVPGVIDTLLKQVKRHVKTNIPAKMVPRLVSLAQDVDLDRRQTLVLSGSRFGETCYPCPPNGLYILKANVPAIKSAVQGIFKANVKAARTIQDLAEEAAVVHVLNGTKGPNTRAIKVASGLADLGMDAAVPPIDGGKADNRNYKKTVITLYNGVAELAPQTVKRLKKVLAKHELVEVEDPNAEADIVVTVGQRTKAI